MHSVSLCCIVCDPTQARKLLVTTMQVSLAHVLRSYELTLPRHNISLAGDTYFYRILLRLSLNSVTTNWRVRLIAECRRARHSYGGVSQYHTHGSRNAGVKAAAAFSEVRPGHKRRQETVLRSARAHPKRARSLSGCPAPPRSDSSRWRSLSPVPGREPLVRFRGSDAQPGGDQQRQRGGRVVCEGVGCSRSREHSPERAAIYDVLKELERGRLGEQSSTAIRQWRAANSRSQDRSPQRVADEQAHNEWRARVLTRDRAIQTSAHVAIQTPEVIQHAAVESNEPYEVARKAQQVPEPALFDGSAAHPLHCSCQQCCHPESAWRGSGDGCEWADAHSDSFSDSALADLTCCCCRQPYEPSDAGRHSSKRRLRPSSAAGVRGEADTRLSAAAGQMPCRLCRLRDLIPRWRGTADACTCEA